MNRFDFLKDGPPDIIDRARSVRVPEEARTPLMALATAVVVVSMWWGLERYWLASAMHEESLAQARLADSRADLAATKLIRTDVEQMLALDHQLRDIRLSGSTLAKRFTDIGNHVPRHAWLTSISTNTDGFEIAGKADGLFALSETVSDLMRSSTAAAPRLMRASKDERGRNLIAFTVQTEKKHEAPR